ncbi:MAG: pyridoxal 5'-phosphate synthase glutaminase subunit PdxT [Actinobacteria bacterium]|nr:MAG: pyridoxal 5'-phosphate synthase glutaminase subunit PdxT [Actinomycetota bacterium]
MRADGIKAGVLALQGAFREHREVLDALGVDSTEVRIPEQLAGLDCLFLPGGESTTMGKLLRTSGLLEPIAARVRDGLPTFGTCAGLILLAREVRDGRADQPTFDALDIALRRNAYGTQVASFEAPLEIDGLVDAGLGADPFPGVFIRAPVVETVGPDVDVLSRYDGHPVLIRHARVWASTFHPELSGDLRIHQWFLREVTA